ncbi:MAG: DNA polymerase III subunit delta [Wolbachia endosymbiont of Fragariocoptes setiger]|nr:DNA polymerase III subunit delta [Wolbachia endosymbiont of Fragariocoptes setiger]
MRITPLKINSFLKKPNVLSGVLIYGSDSNRIDLYTREVTINLPEYSVQIMDFTVVNKSPVILLSELANISMFCGKKLIKLINAQGNISNELKNILEHYTKDHYILISSSDNSSLKSYMETSKFFGVILCYKDNNDDIYHHISNNLKQNGINCTNEMIQYLKSHFENNKVSIHLEFEKLSLYLGKRKDITFDDIESCLSSSNSNYTTLDSLCSAVINKNIDQFMRISDMMISYENFSPIGLIRVISNYFLKLESVLMSIHHGMDEQEAINQLNPALFFKQLQNFKSHLKKLSLCEVRKTLKKLINCEVACKTIDLDNKMLFQQMLIQ